MPDTQKRIESITVVGSGVARIAAATALTDSGYRVRLVERRPYLGGRASSYEHPGTGEVIDKCQHLLFGCRTNLIDVYRRIGAFNKLRWFDEFIMLLVEAAVTKQVRATFSIRPKLDEIRPNAQGPCPNIFLAGDWTATGWPATMEGGRAVAILLRKP